jgi:hypothetical protein
MFKSGKNIQKLHNLSLLSHEKEYKKHKKLSCYYKYVKKTVFKHKKDFKTKQKDIKIYAARSDWNLTVLENLAESVYLARKKYVTGCKVLANIKKDFKQSEIRARAAT